MKTNQINFSLFALAGIILSSGLLAFATLSHGTDWGGDFASYIMQAQNIIAGSPQEFVEANRFAIEQSLHKIGPVAYPWGTSLLLSPFIALFGVNILALKGLNLICYMLLLIVLWFGTGNRLPTLYAVGFVAIFAFNPTMLLFLNHIISDIPFLLFSTLTMYLIGRIAIERRLLFSPIVDPLILGFLLAFSVFIRTNGVLLVFTLLSVHAVMIVKRYLPAATPKRGKADSSQRSKLTPARPASGPFWLNLLPYAAFIGLTLIWRFFFPAGGTSHFNYLEDVTMSLIFSNISLYLKVFSTSFASIPFANLLYWATLPFLFLGMIHCRKRDYYIIVYIVSTVALYAIWPVSDQGLRFLFPILPFYFYFVFIGLEVLVHSCCTPKNKLFAQTCIFLVLIIATAYLMKSSVAQAANNIRNHRANEQGAFSEAANDVFSFIKKNTASDDILIFRKPRVMRLRTGRQSLVVDDSSEISRGDYLCYDTKTSHLQISPADIDKLVDKKQLHRIYSNDVFRLYRIIKSQHRGNYEDDAKTD